MKVTIVTGSRADFWLLEMPIKALEADPYFLGQIVSVHGADFAQAFNHVKASLVSERPDVMLILGDRFEILAAATAAHLERVPIAHIAGGDVSLGSYDDAMRDCISRMATLHFPTSTDAVNRLMAMDVPGRIEMIGNIALDFIMRGDWKRERPIAEPYVVVSYQPETIDGTIEWGAVEGAIGDRYAVLVRPNADAKSGVVNAHIDEFIAKYSLSDGRAVSSLPRAEFLNLLYHADEFIGNSSSMFYEAPALGVKTRVIGKRQQGRVIPTGDGKSSERIVKALREWSCS